MPNVPVWDFDYNLADDVLVAGTLGRSAWLLPNASKSLKDLKITIIKGTPADDVLIGTNGPDLIEGLGENDTIIGKAGDDSIDGGDGDDLIVGQEGNDNLTGGGNRDKFAMTVGEGTVLTP